MKSDRTFNLQVKTTTDSKEKLQELQEVLSKKLNMRLTLGQTLEFVLANQLEILSNENLRVKETDLDVKSEFEVIEDSHK